MSLTNAQKAQRLEQMAESKLPADAALLRECAGMMRERNPDDAMWEVEYQRRYKRYELCVGENYDGVWHWTATRSGLQSGYGTEHTLDAAQAAAVAWVDGQEGK